MFRVLLRKCFSFVSLVIFFKQLKIWCKVDKDDYQAINQLLTEKMQILSLCVVVLACVWIDYQKFSVFLRDSRVSKIRKRGENRHSKAMKFRTKIISERFPFLQSPGLLNSSNVEIQNNKYCLSFPLK